MTIFSRFKNKQETEILTFLTEWIFKQIAQTWRTPQLSGSLSAYHLVALGSYPMHNIYALFTSNLNAGFTGLTILSPWKVTHKKEKRGRYWSKTLKLTLIVRHQRQKRHFNAKDAFAELPNVVKFFEGKLRLAV